MIRRKIYEALERDNANVRLMWNEGLVARDIAERRNDAQIDDIIDALGLRAAYPFKSVNGTRPLSGYSYGRKQFLRDVKLAAETTAGMAAKARLDAALNRTDVPQEGLK